VILSDDRSTVQSDLLDDPHLLQKFDQRSVFREWSGDVVGTPWESESIAAPAARCATDLTLQFQQHEIQIARALQMPTRAQSRDPTPDDDYRDVDPLSDRRNRDRPFSQSMACREVRAK
jgi:hypothetical protein